MRGNDVTGACVDHDVISLVYAFGLHVPGPHDGTFFVSVFLSFTYQSFTHVLKAADFPACEVPRVGSWCGWICR